MRGAYISMQTHRGVAHLQGVSLSGQGLGQGLVRGLGVVYMARA